MKLALAILSVIVGLITLGLGIFDHLITKEPWRSKLLGHAEAIEAESVKIKEEPIGNTLLSFSKFLDRWLLIVLKVLLCILLLEGILLHFFKIDFSLFQILLRPSFCFCFCSALLISSSIPWMVKPKKALWEIVTDRFILFWILMPSIIYVGVYVLGYNDPENSIYRSFLQLKMLLDKPFLFIWFIAFQILWGTLILIVIMGSGRLIGSVPYIGIWLYKNFLKFIFTFGDKLRWWNLLLINAILDVLTLYVNLKS